MARNNIRSDSHTNSSSYIDSLSRDELLAIQHEEYIQRVSDSGIPLWVLDYYYSGPSVSFQEKEQPPLRNSPQ